MQRHARATAHLICGSLVNQVGDDVRSSFTFIISTNVFNYSFHTIFYLHIYIFIYFYIYICIYLILANKMPVETRSTRVKVHAISDPDNVPVETLLTNEKLP